MPSPRTSYEIRDLDSATMRAVSRGIAERRRRELVEALATPVRLASHPAIRAAQVAKREALEAELRELQMEVR